MGLTEKEAAARLKSDGANVLGEKKKVGAVRIFVGQFKDVMVMILLGATVVSVLLGEVSDAVTIILIVLLNAILGFIQEFRTEHTLEALRNMTAPTAKCYRDGELREPLLQGSQLLVDVGEEVGDTPHLRASARRDDACPTRSADG